MLQVLSFPLDAQWENILCFFRIGLLLAIFVFFVSYILPLAVLGNVSLYIVNKVLSHNKNNKVLSH